MSAGVLVFLGVVMLGGLTGLLWQNPRTYGRAQFSIELSPSVLGPTTDWLVWSASLLLSISPSILMLARRRAKPDAVVVLTSLIFPLLSLMTTSFSYFVGATLLVGSGFLAAYALVSRSEQLVGTARGYAIRLVWAETFAFLAVMAAGGVVSVLHWRTDTFSALISGSPMDTSLKMLSVDLEAFYLARPLLPWIFIALAVAAIAALFKEPIQLITGPISTWFTGEKHRTGDSASPNSGSWPLSNMVPPKSFPYLILAGSIVLGVAIAVYPYTVANLGAVLGGDSPFYLGTLLSMNKLADALPLLKTDRGFFLLLLFLMKILTGLSAVWVVRLMPALLSGLLAVSSFALVREGTGRLWAAAFVALLSVVSAQTALGMAAGIITNWFALSLANFTFALIVRSIRLHSTAAAVESLAVSLVLLVSYALLWVVLIATLVLVFFASVIPFRVGESREWKYEAGVLSGVLFGNILIPVAFLFLAATPLLGFRPQGLDPSHWLVFGWSYLTQATPWVLRSAPATLQGAFDFAEDLTLPFLALLSIVAFLADASQTRIFRRIISATILVPFAITVMTPGLQMAAITPPLAWRGLYIMPMYLTGALGAENVIRRVNGRGSPWSSWSRLASAGTFVAYIFLSQLGYSLRALEILILPWL
jgi:hypothetical protein